MTTLLDAALRSPTPLDTATHLGTARLTVRDLATATSFWHERVGLQPEQVADDLVSLHVGDASAPVLELHGNPDAPLPPHNASGLYHIAILVPSRLDLARALQHLVATNTPMQGASDHAVSEALYLADSEGNGIEIYRDRPREEWSWRTDGIEMSLLPLDLNSLMRELDTVDQEYTGLLPAGTSVGHMHLKVHDTTIADEWYRNVLGMDIVARIDGSASFVSAGGYHHHVGINVWHSRGGPAPEPGSAGLAWSTLVLANEQERVDLLARANGEPLELDGAPAVRDPAGNAWRLVLA